jgi:hypothetical protein
MKRNERATIIFFSNGIILPNGNVISIMGQGVCVGDISCLAADNGAAR